MKPTLIFKRDNKNVKKPLVQKNGVFLIYAPRKIKIRPICLKETIQRSRLICRRNTMGILPQNSGMTK